MAFGRWITPIGILALLAALIAVGVLLIFRWTTSRTALDRRKNAMLAGLMEFYLFRADPWVALHALPRLLLAQLRYLRLLILPFLLSLIPVAWLLVQSQYWVLYRPALPPDRLICKVILNIPPNQMLDQPFQLRFAPDSVPLNAPLRIPDEQSIYWEFPIPAVPPPAALILTGAGQTWTFPVTFRDDWRPVVDRWTVRNWSAWLSNPRGAQLSPAGPLRSVELRYPARSWRGAGIDWNGGVLLIAASFLFAWLLKKPMKVGL